jgi:ribosome recycling factor
MIAVRGARHDALKEVDQAKKDKEISEDEAKRISKRVDEAVSKAKEEVETTARNKETEILTV